MPTKNNGKKEVKNLLLNGLILVTSLLGQGGERLGATAWGETKMNHHRNNSLW
jgi:hypothetical protein